MTERSDAVGHGWRRWAKSARATDGSAGGGVAYNADSGFMGRNAPTLQDGSVSDRVGSAWEEVSRAGWGALGAMSGAAKRMWDSPGLWKALSYGANMDASPFERRMEIPETWQGKAPSGTLGDYVRAGWDAGSGGASHLAANFADGAVGTVPFVAGIPKGVIESAKEDAVSHGLTDEEALSQMASRSRAAGSVAGAATAMKGFSALGEGVVRAGNVAARLSGRPWMAKALPAAYGTSFFVGPAKNMITGMWNRHSQNNRRDAAWEKLQRLNEEAVQDYESGGELGGGRGEKMDKLMGTGTMSSDQQTRVMDARRKWLDDMSERIRYKAFNDDAKLKMFDEMEKYRRGQELDQRKRELAQDEVEEILNRRDAEANAGGASWTDWI